MKADVPFYPIRAGLTKIFGMLLYAYAVTHLIQHLFCLGFGISVKDSYPVALPVIFFQQIFSLNTGCNYSNLVVS